MELGFLASQLSGSDLAFYLGGCRLVFIDLSINPQLLDQTNLKEWLRCILGGGGELT
jgi:hypothetical protein